jgi:hypothetical protein
MIRIVLFGRSVKTTTATIIRSLPIPIQRSSLYSNRSSRSMIIGDPNISYHSTIRDLRKGTSMNPAQLLANAQQLAALLAPHAAQGTLLQPGEHTNDASGEVAQRAWGLVQRQLQGSEDGADAMRMYQRKPDDRGRQHILAQQLVEALQGHAASTAELAAVVRELQGQAANSSHTANVGGHAQIGTMIVGDVHGGLTTGPINFGVRPQGQAEASGAAPGEAAGGDQQALRELIGRLFNDSEIRDLCFDLGIEYENLGGSSKADKVRELITFAARDGRTADLLAAVKKRRPRAFGESK